MFLQQDFISFFNTCYNSFIILARHGWRRFWRQRGSIELVGFEPSPPHHDDGVVPEDGADGDDAMKPIMTPEVTLESNKSVTFLFLSS